MAPDTYRHDLILGLFPLQPKSPTERGWEDAYREAAVPTNPFANLDDSAPPSLLACVGPIKSEMLDRTREVDRTFENETRLQ
jgi:hypothetical protein